MECMDTKITPNNEKCQIICTIKTINMLGLGLGLTLTLPGMSMNTVSRFLLLQPSPSIDTLSGSSLQPGEGYL